MSRMNPRGEAMSLIEEVEQQVTAVNKVPKKEPRERKEFEKLSEEFANALVQSYEELLNEVKNKLEESKLWAEKIQQEAAARAKEQDHLTARVRSFGQKLLDAHKEFQSEKS